MTGAIAAIERHPGRTITAIGTLLVLVYGASLFLLRKPDGRIVVGDAVHYYVYLRSAMYDRDLHFRNEVRAPLRPEGRRGRNGLGVPLDPDGPRPQHDVDRSADRLVAVFRERYGGRRGCPGARLHLSARRIRAAVPSERRTERHRRRGRRCVADAAHCGDALRRASGAVVAADGLARIERPLLLARVPHILARRLDARRGGVLRVLGSPQWIDRRGDATHASARWPASSRWSAGRMPSSWSCPSSTRSGTGRRTDAPRAQRRARW